MADGRGGCGGRAAVARRGVAYYRKSGNSSAKNHEWMGRLFTRQSKRRIFSIMVGVRERRSADEFGERAIEPWVFGAA
jgi:hypothetical protein